MSPVIFSPVELSQFSHGEGCQGRRSANPGDTGEAENDEYCDHHHGGVGGHGTRESVMDVRDEISAGGPQGPTASTSSITGKVRAAGGEVGAVHSSATPSSPPARRPEGGNDAGAKGPYLIGVNSEAAGFAMAPSREIATYQTTRRFPRTLCRAVKGQPDSQTVNDLGKPDAGDPLVRFDEGRGVACRFGGWRLSAYSTKSCQTTWFARPVFGKRHCKSCAPRQVSTL